MSSVPSPMAARPRRLLSGIQPSSSLTLGNYLGAIRQWALLQSTADCFFMVVDLHAITVRQEPQALKQQTEEAIATYLAAGLDPTQSTLFVQSHVSEHAELAWILTCFASMGELSRMTQYKDKSAKYQHIPSGLFQYPCLMAADILLYQTDLVPVGEDQKQHLELTRDLAQRLNQLYATLLFRVPEGWHPPVGAKIMSLQEPGKKMSKSDPNPQAVIFLKDAPEDILKKIKRAVTDSGQEIRDHADQPGIQNLLQIQAALQHQTPAAVAGQFVGKTYGQFKQATADLVIEALRPLREKTQALLKDRSHLTKVLQEGRAKAQHAAAETLRRVHEHVGFLPGRFVP